MRPLSRADPAATTRRHHVASIADAFLTPDRPPEGVPTPADAVELIVAAPGADLNAVVLAALDSVPLARPPADLGERVGIRLPRWERDGRLPAGSRGGVLFWCVDGGRADALGSLVLLGRIAGLLEPRQVTVIWCPGADDGPAEHPDQAARGRVQRLVEAAVPEARSAVHCLGWRDDLAHEVADLARRFA